MSFATKLAAASGTLTAAQIAAATEASKRTVENWRCGRNAPLEFNRAYILARVKRAVINEDRKKLKPQTRS